MFYQWRAAASQLAAAALWGAEQVLPGQLEITTFDNRDHDLTGVETHRSRLDPATITHYRDRPVVVPSLTVVQLADTCHPYLVKGVANDLVKRNWTNFPAILEWVDIVGDRRRPALRWLCLRAIEVGGHDSSPAAPDLGEKLLRAGAGGFEIDYPVETPDGPLFIDYAWHRRCSAWSTTAPPTTTAAWRRPKTPAGGPPRDPKPLAPTRTPRAPLAPRNHLRSAPTPQLLAPTSTSRAPLAPTSWPPWARPHRLAPTKPTNTGTAPHSRSWRLAAMGWHILDANRGLALDETRLRGVGSPCRGPPTLGQSVRP